MFCSSVQLVGRSFGELRRSPEKNQFWNWFSSSRIINSAPPLAGVWFWVWLELGCDRLHYRICRWKLWLSVWTPDSGAIWWDRNSISSEAFEATGTFSKDSFGTQIPLRKSHSPRELFVVSMKTKGDAVAAIAKTAARNKVSSLPANWLISHANRILGDWAPELGAWILAFISLH